MAVDQHRVLADPAKPGVARQGLFHDWRGIHVGAITEVADGGVNALGQLLQAAAHQLVIIAPQCVAGNVAGLAIVQHIPGVGGAWRNVIHAHRNDALRARFQFGRARAFAAVSTHVLHFALITHLQPLVEMNFVVGQVRTADACLREAKLTRPALDVTRQSGVVASGIVVSGNHPLIVSVARAYNSGMSTPSQHCALYTVAQLRVLEREAMAALAISGLDLMRRAATAALTSLGRHWPDARLLNVCCGPGNNGGDGFVLALLAREAGFHVNVIAVGMTASSDAVQARAAWEASGGTVQPWADDSELPDADVQVDALYGIGLNRAPAPDVARLIDCMNASAAARCALDVPSGLNADTGSCPGAAVRADVTVTFIADKRGLRTGRAADHVGKIELASLGVPDSACAVAQPDAHLLQTDALRPRARYANKGLYGHVLVIGGDYGMAGAVRLASESALRAGAGLVSVATHAEHVGILNTTRPELMVHAVTDALSLAPLLARASVLALGPGLGQAAWGRALWQYALDANKPLVLDADGLNLLARVPHQFTAPTVLTPHPGEAARLLGVSVDVVEHDRFAAARELSRRYAAVIILKGVGSLIADVDGRIGVCPWGNPGMASGGMGDLLTGIVAALLAQGCDAWQAACLGVGLHARAGDVAAQAGERGLLASDLLVPLRVLSNATVWKESEHE